VRQTLTAFLLTSAAFAGGLLGGTTVVHRAHASSGGSYDGIDTLARALATVETQYIEARSTEDLVYDAVRGITRGLDAHSVFLGPSDYGDLRGRTEGVRAGVGVQLDRDADGWLLARVYAGGPAALAGLQGGERLETVEGSAVTELDEEAVRALLDGELESAVALGVSDAAGSRTVTVVRDTVREPATMHARSASGVGYVRLVHFQREAAADLRRSLELLEQEGKLEGLVLDVRGNAGGLLEEAIAMVDLFVEEGPIVRIEGRDDAERDSFSATSSGTRSELKLVILIDGGSASASEILAGALQARGRATLVGSPTYGKGSVQRVYEFEDGAALKLTVARYVLPGDTRIVDGEGLRPDVLVRRAAAADSPLGRLSAEVAHLPPEERARITPLLTELDVNEDERSPVIWMGSLATRQANDPQLQLAMATASP